MYFKKGDRTMRNIRIVITFTLVMFFLFSSCTKQERNTVKIGAILPLTGRLSTIGSGEQKGILMAIDSLQMKYGVDKIEILFEDFASEPKNAASAANKLINIDNVSAIITSTTAAAEVVSPIVEKSKIIHFVISPDVDILQKSRYNFRVYYNFNTEAKLIIEFIKENSIKTISFIAVRYSSIQKEIENIIEPYAIENNIKVLSKDFFDITEKDFKSAIVKTKLLNPELIFLAPQVNQVEMLSKQLKEYQYFPSQSGKFVGSFTYIWKPLDNLSGLDGFIVATPKFQLSNEESPYAKYFYKKFNFFPNFDMMFAYDNMMIISDLLISSDKKFDKFEELFNNLKAKNCASGKINFIGNRDTDVEIVLSEVVKGKYVK